MKRALLAFALFVGAACNSGTNVGSPCTVNTDCDFGHTCDTSSPGGFCTKGCTFEGAVDECPGGSICTYTGGTVMICSNFCTADADCRNLYGCYEVKGSTKKACGPKRS